MNKEEAKQQSEDEAFAKRVVGIVVADLKANGRIKWALVGVFRDEEPTLERPQLSSEMNPNTRIPPV